MGCPARGGEEPGSAWSAGDALEGWSITVNDPGPGLWCSPIEAFQRQSGGHLAI